MALEKIFVPILIIGFNRPHCIRKIIESLSEFKPVNLYFSIDAPRKGKNGEERLVEEVKNIVKNITWDCEKHYLFHDKNVGAEVNVSNAISWVLNENPYLIVNEDDVYAHYSFYKFEQDMLIKYKDDERIGMVSGENKSPIKMPFDYTFGKYGYTWGWGTWKRVWKDFDLNEEISDEVLDYDYLKGQCADDVWIRMIQSKFRGIRQMGRGNIYWDFIFEYLRYKKKYLSIIPKCQLTSNIGIEGLHYSGYSLDHFTKIDKSFEVVKHPSNVELDKRYDIYHYCHYINPSFALRVYRKLKKIYLGTFRYNKKYRKPFFEIEQIL